jgi:hypothetical protein
MLDVRLPILDVRRLMPDVSLPILDVRLPILDVKRLSLDERG